MMLLIQSGSQSNSRSRRKGDDGYKYIASCPVGQQRRSCQTTLCYSMLTASKMSDKSCKS